MKRHAFMGLQKYLVLGSRRFSRSFRVFLFTFDVLLNSSMRVKLRIIHEVMNMCFKMIACWNHFQITDIFLMIIQFQIKECLKFSNMFDFA